SPKLSILEIAYPDCCGGSLNKALKKLPKLEELSIYCALSESQVDLALGSYCPDLKPLGLNHCSIYRDEEMIAISKNLQGLMHLEIRNNLMLSNTGVQAILDGCPCPKVLDLRWCPDVDLKGLWKTIRN
ncbi:F-box protein SKIP19-like protein, partial [Tanacetum coccineum]